MALITEEEQAVAVLWFVLWFFGIRSPRVLPLICGNDYCQRGKTIYLTHAVPNQRVRWPKGTLMCDYKLEVDCKFLCIPCMDSRTLN